MKRLEVTPKEVRGERSHSLWLTRLSRSSHTVSYKCDSHSLVVLRGMHYQIASY